MDDIRDRLRQGVNGMEAEWRDVSDVVRRVERRHRRRRIRAGLLAATIGAAAVAVTFTALRETAADRDRGVTDRESVQGSPPSNGEVLYTKKVSKGWHLFALDPATGRERQITDGFRDYGSDWSPDGTQVVYDTETRAGGGGIWVENADGTGAVQLTEDGSFPSWSPDGTQIAFASNDLVASSQVSYIYVMNADGSNLHQITDGAVYDSHPVWSPDGSLIAFLHYSVGGSGLYVMNADGSGQRRLLDDQLVVISYEWSSDGATLLLAAYTRADPSRRGVFRIDVEGSGRPEIVPGTETPYPQAITSVASSPDGRWIAYTDTGKDAISFVAVDGSDRYSVPIDPGSDTIEEVSWAVAPT